MTPRVLPPVLPLRPFPAVALAVLMFLTVPAVPEDGPVPGLQEATTLYYRGRYEESLELFRALADWYPRAAGPRLDLVRLLCETGLYEEAFRHIADLSGADPGNPRYRRELLKIAFLSGKAGTGVSLPSASPDDPESLLWSALDWMEKGDLPTALSLIDEALGLSPYFPLAWLFRGEILLSQGAFPEAEEAYTEALKQEPNLTVAFLPLARTRIARGRIESAFGLLGRARESLPWNREIEDELSALTAGHPELLVSREEQKQLARKIKVPPAVEPVALSPETIPPIRIGLAEKLKELHLKTGSGYTLTSLSNLPTLRGEGGEVLSIIQDQGGVAVLGADGKELGRDPWGFVLSYPDPGATTILFDLAYGSGYFFAGFEDRSYRGLMRFENRKDGITVVNTLSVEEYLYSTVPGEMPSGWPKAALEAQAVAARTYTLEGMGRYESRGFDLLASVSSAAYQGVGRERKTTSAAVDATRGTVVTSGGRLVNTVYSSNSGGYTESSESVWSFASPLTAVPDLLTAPREAPLPPDELALWLETSPLTYSSQPDYSSRSSFRWRQVVPAAELSSRLGAEIGRIRSIVTRGRGISGRVEKVEVIGTEGSTTVKWDAIRSRLGGLRSNLFIVEPRIGKDGLPDYFLFTGGGWGHGVGMDQTGAAGMAAAGFSFDAILGHYYPGTVLETRY